MRPSVKELYRRAARNKLPEVRSDEFEGRVAYRPSYTEVDPIDGDDELHASVDHWCRVIWPLQRDHCPVQMGVVDYLLNADADRGLVRRNLTPLVPLIRDILPRPGPRTRQPDDEIEVISDIVRVVLRNACTIPFPDRPPQRSGRMPRRMQGAPPRHTEGWSGSRVAPIDALDALPRGDNTSRLWSIAP